MTFDPNEFPDLMKRVAQRDQEAARQLIHLYGNILLIHIREYLRRCPVLRNQFDSDWVGNGVWGDIFCNPAFCDRIKTPDEFVQYLVGVAATHLNRCRKRYVTAQKRDLRRQRHLSDPKIANETTSLVDSQPTPDEKAEFQDIWERWLFSLTGKQREIILFLRAGFSQREIAEQYNCCERTIERQIDEIRNYRPPPLPVPGVCPNYDTEKKLIPY